MVVENKLIYPELSFLVTGLLFKVHNELGRYGRERQYGDLLETHLKDANVAYVREKPIPVEGIENPKTNIVDFEIEGK
jgi:hypothetical protein